MVTENEFLAFVSGVFGVSREGLSLTTTYGAIPQWDSVMHLRLVMELEDEYKVDIPIDAVPGLKTLGAFFSRVKG